MMRLRYQAAALLALLCATSSACLIDDSPPVINPGTCNANGQCDQDEDCRSCPTDCSCCNAIIATSATISPTDAALGSPDGNTVPIGELDVIELTFGLEAADSPSAGLKDPDIQIDGTVTSVSSAPSTDCPQSSDGVGALEVYASENGADFKLLGLWTQQKSTFDLGCAGLARARVIRIQAQPNAVASLDSITAINCGEGI